MPPRPPPRCCSCPDHALRLPEGYTLQKHDRVDSTNAAALQLAADGADHGTVVIADSQTAGRGRRGHSWVSLPGNLFLTILLRPPSGRPLGQLSFVAAIALGEALHEIDGIAFKWPNDILRHGRKIAGVLIEADGGAVAVGIGVNLTATPDQLGATAADLGGTVALPVFAGDLCISFDRWYRQWIDQGFAQLRQVWLARAAGLGGTITAAGRSGRFADLGPDGALVLAGADGTATTITAGEVFFGEPACC